MKNLTEDKEYQCEVIVKGVEDDHGLGPGILVRAVYLFKKGCNPVITAMETEKDLVKDVFEFKWKELP